VEHWLLLSSPGVPEFDLRFAVGIIAQRGNSFRNLAEKSNRFRVTGGSVLCVGKKPSL
jgi:hypothetical protein